MSQPIDVLMQGDCLVRFKEIASGSVDFVFADPPFNIGYRYDVYEDRREAEEYESWCERWMLEIARVLKPNGSFWLAIGDEFAAELKMIAQRKAGFYCRSWVIWYYTFGVNCVRAFSRSHTHLFHFVRDLNDFTFNAENPAVRIPSARQLVYADNRSNPKGRLPDNTWLFRPQDSPASAFLPSHDVWYYSRVAGTFKERQGFHGCQMPEQLLARILRISSNPGETVLDPFTGSGTTLVVAKKLGRRFVGFELSKSYAERVNTRLDRIRMGDPLDGPEDAVRSSPDTKSGRAKGKVVNGRVAPQLDATLEKELPRAFKESCGSESVDWVLCNPEMGEAFAKACESRKLEGSPIVWNRLLLRLRKAGKLGGGRFKGRRLSTRDMDAFSHAAEIAMHLLNVEYQLSIDELLCDPDLAEAFDHLAESFTHSLDVKAPKGAAPLAGSKEFRWAALAIRKRAKSAVALGAKLFGEWRRKKLPSPVPIRSEAVQKWGCGVYCLFNSEGAPIYVGESFNVAQRVSATVADDANSPWSKLGVTTVWFTPTQENEQHGLQSVLVTRLRPAMNSLLLVGESNQANHEAMNGKQESEKAAPAKPRRTSTIAKSKAKPALAKTKSMPALKNVNGAKRSGEKALSQRGVRGRSRKAR